MQVLVLTLKLSLQSVTDAMTTMMTHTHHSTREPYEKDSLAFYFDDTSVRYQSLCIIRILEKKML